ncbi:MAG: hypothetical protein JW888_09705 [Pirellulales bacterium]|nr:hypothetical protein [Pirellulales bacterium]
MKGRIVFGALLVSVALASQGFGFELLNDLLGMNRGCSTNACAEPACCEQACQPECCEQPCKPMRHCAKPKCCEPKCCEPKCCEKNCCEPACCDPCCKPRCDLFAGLKGLFACKKCCCEPCGTACCEDTKCCAPEPKCCEESCCEPNCCDPGCGGICIPKCTPVRDLLEDLCSLRICVYHVQKCNCCCDPGCCEESCGCGGAAPSTTAPKTAPAEEAAPLPKAPLVDPSASLRPSKFYKASRSIVRN